MEKKTNLLVNTGARFLNKVCTRWCHGQNGVAYFMLTMTVLFWSGNFVLGRGVRDLIPPVSLNFWRWTGALLLLLPVALPRFKRQRQVVARHWKLLAFLSIPSITIFNTFIYKALRSTSTTNTVLVNAMIPVFILLLMWGACKQPLKPSAISGIILSTAGLFIIITRADPAIMRDFTFAPGDLWTLGAGLSWAFYSVMLKRSPSELDPFVFLTVLISFGLVFTFPFYLWELGRHGGFEINRTSMSSIAYVCVFPSVLAYFFWNSGVARVGPDHAGIFFHLMPVFSILLAAVFLHEQLRLFHIIGIIFIFSGIALVTVSRRRPG